MTDWHYVSTLAIGECDGEGIKVTDGGPLGERMTVMCFCDTCNRFRGWNTEEAMA